MDSTTACRTTISVPGRPPDGDLVARAREGSEAAFGILIRRYHRELQRLARNYVRDDALAEDVVQDTWIGVLKGVDRFEGRSSFRTWLRRVLVNRAKSRALREARYLPLEESDEFEPLSDPFDRNGAWRIPLRPWRITPERLALSTEVREALAATLRLLPQRQRAVVDLRDVQGLDAQDVCAILDLTESNQRVLLHRGRAKLRAALAALVQSRAMSATTDCRRHRPRHRSRGSAVRRSPHDDGA
ncbi:MAG: sigma-70 family RNA polymerase sigma factor [Acidobacteriota bacterium]